MENVSISKQAYRNFSAYSGERCESGETEKKLAEITRARVSDVKVTYFPITDRYTVWATVNDKQYYGIGGKPEDAINNMLKNNNIRFKKFDKSKAFFL